MTTRADRIRAQYGVPARIGMRVLYDERPGIITGYSGFYLRIRLDGDPRPTGPYHPADDRITYPSGQAETFTDPLWLIITPGGELLYRYTSPAETALARGTGEGARRVLADWETRLAVWEAPAPPREVNVVAGLMLATVHTGRLPGQRMFGPVALTGWSGQERGLTRGQVTTLATVHEQVASAAFNGGDSTWEKATHRWAKRLEQVK